MVENGHISIKNNILELFAFVDNVHDRSIMIAHDQALSYLQHIFEYLLLSPWVNQTNVISRLKGQFEHLWNLLAEMIKYVKGNNNMKKTSLRM